MDMVIDMDMDPYSLCGAQLSQAFSASAAMVRDSLELGACGRKHPDPASDTHLRLPTLLRELPPPASQSSYKTSLIDV